jgi:ABC-type transport system substrate-binding protein/DNA-binding SARP family transcriptional activator/DNA-binding beta-propeller fold protein YncE
MTWDRLALDVLGRKHGSCIARPTNLGDIRVDRMLQVDDGEIGDTYGFGILGPLTATRGGVPLRLGTPQQRALLAVLVCQAGRVVTRERLVDALWGDAPRHAALSSIRAHVSHLRSVLEPEHEPGTAYRVLVTESSGYRLAVPEANVDASRFKLLADEGRSQLETGDAGAALAAFDEALSLSRGEVLVDLPRYSFISGVAIRLDELCAVAEEGRVDALLELGRTTAALADIDRMLDRHPLREGLTGRRMVALYRAGRQSEALEAFRNLRKRLDEELGIEPSTSIADLHRRILQHDPTLLHRSANQPELAATDRVSPTTAAIAASPAVTEVPMTRASPPPVTRSRPGRRTRRVLSSAVVALGLGVVVLGAATSGTVELTGNAVGVLDPSGRVVNALPAGTDPKAVTFGGGSLWVANQGDNTVLRIHPDTSAVLQRWEVGDSPSAIVSTETDVWVANAGDATVTRINIAANRVVQSAISVGSRPEALAVGPTGVWVANSGDNTIQRIDQSFGRPAAPVNVGDGPDGLLVDGAMLWVANGRDGTVSRLDATTGAELASPVRVGSGPRGMARFGEELWVAEQLSQSVSRIDVRSGRVRSVFVGDGPTSLAVLDDAVWVSEQYAGTLTRIDPATDSHTTVAVGATPRAMVSARNQIWFSVGATSSPEHRGGTLTIAAARLPGAGSSGIDPADVYEVTTAWANRLVYEGLVSLRYADGQDVQALVPSLATRLPLPSDGGRTYTFELRRGIRYSTGAEVRATDLARGVQRAVLHSGGNLYLGIVGAQACIDDPKHCDLSQGVQPDDATGRVSFHLTEPDPDFLYRLALFVFPTPADYTDESSVPMPGVGPYQISAYQSGLEYTLSRNPHFAPWSVAAAPAGYPDVITWLKVPDVRAAAAAVNAGQADLAELTPLGNRSQTREVVDEVSIRQPTQIRRGGPTGTFFIFVNSSIPPFDNVLARRAVNLAVDRSKIVDLAGGPLTADPSCQVIPPGFPGYLSYCPYTVNPEDGAYHGPDLATARRLVAESGTLGASVTVTDLVGDANPPFDDYVAQVLTDLGYDVTVERLPRTDANAEHFDDPAGGVQVGSGGWLPDYPRPSTYYDQLFRCPAKNQEYAFGYCDPETDRAADAALALEAADPGRANRAWAEVQHRVVDGAPAVFGVTSHDVWYTSKRIGNYQQAEIYGPLFSQVWVR